MSLANTDKDVNLMPLHKKSNIVPINRNPDSQDLLIDICEQLNSLTMQYIHPKTGSLLSHLEAKLDDKIGEAESDQEIIQWIDCRNSLKQDAQKISQLFTDCSVSIPETTKSVLPESSSLSLLDNHDLNHKLLWQSAADHMPQEQSIQCLLRIQQRFEQGFPSYKELIPASPQKLCESFSRAIDVINPAPDTEQFLLNVFVDFIKSETVPLWQEADELLERSGLEIKKPEKKTYDLLPSDATSAQLTSTEANLLFEPQVINSLVDKLVDRVENMLIQDEIIPESAIKKVRSADLASVLTSLQHEIVKRPLTIQSLSDTVKSALENRGEKNPLTQRHEDLINLVGLLFDYILNDQHLPERVRNIIALLQIPVLKLTIFEPEFLSNHQHSARLLLNDMTSVGLLCNDNHTASNSIYLLIETTVKSILSGCIDNPEIFTDSLIEFREKLESILKPAETDLPADKEEIPVVITSPEETPSEPDIAPPAERENEAEGLLQEEEIVLESDTPESLSEMIGEHAKDTEAEAFVEFSPISGLKTGQWVVFVGEGEDHRLRCKLASIDLDLNRYTFENCSGMKVAECDGQYLNNGINNGTIMIEDNQQIFDRAINAVFDRILKK